MSKKSLFDWLKDITQTKAEFDFSEKSSYSPYMINRFISFSNLHLELANAMNLVGKNIPPHINYNFYKSVFPKGFHRFNYIKAKKEKNLNKDNALECISKFFEISPRESLIYYNQLSEEQILEIVQKYEHGKIAKRRKKKNV